MATPPSTWVPNKIWTQLPENVKFDVVIIGAGIVGCPLACQLAQQKRNVLIVERDMDEPNRIVGELLQPGGCQILRELGFGECVEGIDSPEVHGYAVFRGPQMKEEIVLNYPAQNGVRPKGRSFHHGRFIMNLRRKALLTPNVYIIQASVKESSLIEDSAKAVIGVKLQPKSEVGQVRPEQQVFAPLNIVSDGCYSVFRNGHNIQSDEDKPHYKSKFVGLVLNSPLPHAGYGHVFLVNPSPVLMYPISSTEVRVLVDVEVDTNTGFLKHDPTSGQLATHFLTQVAEQLPKSMQGPFMKKVVEMRDDKMYPNVFPSMPNSTLHPNPFFRKGFLMVGDCFNMRHPLTGGGMTVALSDVRSLSIALKGVDLTNATAMEAAVRRYYKLRYPLASTVNILAASLYAVFASYHDPLLSYMRNATWRYLEFGEVISKRPMGMLGGLIPSPTNLITNFYAVAALASAMTVFEHGWIPWPSRVFRAFRVVLRSCSLIMPILWREHVLSFFHPTPRRV